VILENGEHRPNGLVYVLTWMPIVEYYPLLLSLMGDRFGGGKPGGKRRRGFKTLPAAAAST
jgi:hypothetical protein